MDGGVSIVIDHDHAWYQNRRLTTLEDVAIFFLEIIP
jgi:hypothetical protein